ncbi:MULTISPECIES: iron chelate uptake ABC transporter family permease subunit [Geobacillus]|jgi:iron complex transport system permease protein|uniref:Ferrichrome ABC transporter (Permease) n=2 Tax=Geobacillus thermodenitrificans TaxID=33940 RepID=A4IMT9_GEOTN|nr:MULTISPECIES: iron chelate uptake ABC transporter family permease subunit [Geobacillus]ABO66643.1 Ferrichrome ABC transporter (permease) [Geobacillus thermodenitrificans NG80-2]ARA96992.1 iron ABC transporter permease [Geobacillus thermodenitrificans]ARP42400.1 Ferric anguibactin transport system permease protein FatC [Geobacillus thermodenitrificans]ATO36268.1 iron ABC transporter permease [Geobacillus thermodenitrificans]MED3906201.1 iron chelate uptake ABC transporter family permease sub
MSNRMKTAALVVLALAFIALFLFTELRGNIEYVLRSRGEKVTAMVLVGWAGAISTVLFQTITNNRILTPSIIGLDSVYMLIQTAVVFLFGSTTLTMMNDTVHFLLSAGGMIGFSVFLYSFLFRREGQTVYFILLVGMILGTFFQSVTSFMQYLIDPNEFSIIQDRMFASFNNMKTELLWPAGIVIVVAIWYTYRHLHELDVLSLGKDHAINLGVSYETVVRRMLMVIAVLVSVSTALVGPIMFFGLIVANVAYAFFQTYEHRYLLVGAALFGIIALVSGQFVVERVFTFSTTLSVIINMVGGVYFLYLLLKERKAW